jgi:hypothetical protein
MAEEINEPEQIALRIKAEAFAENFSITVLTEDSNDNLFWERIIKYAIGKHHRVFFPLEPQKGSTVIKRYVNYVDSRLLICTDSDSEYLYTPKEQLWYFDKQYIYHTWIYSMDSYHILTESLNELLKEISQANAQISYDFDGLLKSLSTSLSPFLYCWIFSHQESQALGKSLFSKHSLEKILKQAKQDFLREREEQKIFDTIKRLVSIKVTTFENELNETEITQIRAMMDRLSEQFSIDESESLLFLNGHNIFDFVSNILEVILKTVKEKHLKIVRVSGAEESQINKIKNRYDSYLLKPKRKPKPMFENDMKRMPNYEVLDILYSNNIWTAKVVDSIKSDFE